MSLNQRRAGVGLVPPGGNPAPAGEVRGRRGGLPGGKPARLRATTWSRPAPARPGQRRCRGRCDRAVSWMRPMHRSNVPGSARQHRIAVGVGDLETARRAAAELEAISVSHASDLLRATAAQAGGTVALTEGDAGARTELRRALGTWQELGAPYEAACSRVLIGTACRRAGRRRRGSDGARSPLAASSGTWGRRLTSPSAIAARARSVAGHPWVERARGGGASTGGRQDQPGDRHRACPQRAYGPAAPAEYLQQARACRRGLPRRLSPTSTTYLRPADGSGRRLGYERPKTGFPAIRMIANGRLRPTARRRT